MTRRDAVDEPPAGQEAARTAAPIVVVPIFSQPVKDTLADLSAASVASNNAHRPLVSIMPIA